MHAQGRHQFTLKVSLLILLLALQEQLEILAALLQVLHICLTEIHWIPRSTG